MPAMLDGSINATKVGNSLLDQRLTLGFEGNISGKRQHVGTEGTAGMGNLLQQGSAAGSQDRARAHLRQLQGNLFANAGRGDGNDESLPTKRFVAHRTSNTLTTPASATGSPRKRRGLKRVYPGREEIAAPECE